jgi:hypothetical protein
MDEIKSDREQFMQNYRTKYVYSMEEYRKDALVWIGLVASFLGVLSGFSDKLNFVKPYLVPILYGLLLDIVIGLVIITIFTIYRNRMANYFTLIENGYLLSIFRHNFLLGIISMASLDIGPIMLYQYNVMQQFAMVLIKSRDELYVSFKAIAGLKFVRKQHAIDFLNRAFLLEKIMEQEYRRYKFYENEFTKLSLVPSRSGNIGVNQT